MDPKRATNNEQKTADGDYSPHHNCGISKILDEKDKGDKSRNTNSNHHKSREHTKTKPDQKDSGSSSSESTGSTADSDMVSIENFIQDPGKLIHKLNEPKLKFDIFDYDSTIEVSGGNNTESTIEDYSAIEKFGPAPKFGHF